MPVPRRDHLTLADYLVSERLSPQKHEFVDGQIYVMAGGSPRHNYLVGRVLAVLTQHLGAGPCFPLSADQRIATADGLHTYSDGSVFCGPMQLGPEQTATNPVVLVEVLSDSTRAYDRGEKLERYRTIPSLRHVVLIEPDGTDVEVWSGGEGGPWSRRVSVEGGDQVELPAVGVSFSVAELYAGIERVG